MGAHVFEFVFYMRASSKRLHNRIQIATNNAASLFQSLTYSSKSFMLPSRLFRYRDRDSVTDYDALICAL